ncbi:hypothetical protein [Poseidonibacter lekithochrous]|uniref:hypothetical protein n=1 Tax=Poseidonibacter lekithochrous TaxID=1904463 RepID=UPI000D3C4392|nr:hypothetical protein [Poseidonibacter lekithochrous]
MKSLLFLCLAFITLVFNGCSSKNELKTGWKKSIAQLQITPVMPMKEELKIGEVYRYLKKPSSFSLDGQVEPGVAFLVDINESQIKKNKLLKWPSFKYDNSFNSNVGAAIKSAAFLSSSFEKKNDLLLTITDSFSNSIPIYDIKNELLNIKKEKGADGKVVMKYILKEKYRDKLSLLRYSWKFIIKKYKRKVVYLRIPTEVYYAKKIQVTAVSNVDSKTQIDLKSVENSLDTYALKNNKDKSTPNIDVAYVSNSTISLNETFDKPMAIGYRGILLEVYIDNGFEVNELPEDADLEFWSGL